MHTFVPEFLKLGKPHSYIRLLERGNSYKSGTCLWQSKHFKTAYYLPSLQKSFGGIIDGARAFSASPMSSPMREAGASWVFALRVNRVLL